MTTMLSTRRQFLAVGAALPVALHAMAQGHAATRWVFLGTDLGKGIYRARWDAAMGTLGTVELAAETDRPAFFALHPSLPVLYAVEPPELAWGWAVRGKHRSQRNARLRCELHGRHGRQL
jgi:uncharacterized protein (DUF1501 family)